MVATYVYATYVDPATSTVNTDGLNVRSTPDSSSASNIVAQLNKGTKVKRLGKEGNWIKISLGWRNASSAEVLKYVDPANIAEGTQSYFQFLKLSEGANLNPTEVNTKILAGKAFLPEKDKPLSQRRKRIILTKSISFHMHCLKQVTEIPF